MPVGRFAAAVAASVLVAGSKLKQRLTLDYRWRERLRAAVNPIGMERKG